MIKLLPPAAVDVDPNPADFPGENSISAAEMSSYTFQPVRWSMDDEVSGNG